MAAAGAIVATASPSYYVVSLNQDTLALREVRFASTLSLATLFPPELISIVSSYKGGWLPNTGAPLPFCAVRMDGFDAPRLNFQRTARDGLQALGWYTKSVKLSDQLYKWEIVDGMKSLKIIPEVWDTTHVVTVDSLDFDAPTLALTYSALNDRMAIPDSVATNGDDQFLFSYHYTSHDSEEDFSVDHFCEIGQRVGTEIVRLQPKISTQMNVRVELQRSAFGQDQWNRLGIKFPEINSNSFYEPFLGCYVTPCYEPSGSRFLACVDGSGKALTMTHYQTRSYTFTDAWGQTEQNGIPSDNIMCLKWLSPQHFLMVAQYGEIYDCNDDGTEVTVREIPSIYEGWHYSFCVGESHLFISTESDDPVESWIDVFHLPDLTRSKIQLPQNTRPSSMSASGDTLAVLIFYPGVEVLPPRLKLFDIDSGSELAEVHVPPTTTRDNVFDPKSGNYHYQSHFVHLGAKATPAKQKAKLKAATATAAAELATTESC